MKDVFTGRPHLKTPQHPVPHQDQFFLDFHGVLGRGNW